MPEGDYQSAAKSMYNLFMNRDLRARISGEACRFVTSNYSWEMTARHLERIYTKAVEKG